MKEIKTSTYANKSYQRNRIPKYFAIRIVFIPSILQKMTEKESANLKISRFSFSNAIFIEKIPLIASNLYQYLPAK